MDRLTVTKNAMTEQKDDRRPHSLSAADWREWMKLIRLCILIVVIGLVWASGAGWFKWHVAQKADRLRAEGQPVQATVTDFYQGGSGRFSSADKVYFSYFYGDRRFNAKARCGGFTGCVQQPGPEITVWVDRKHPEEFVLADGNTDDSLFFLNSWITIPVGTFAVVIGGVPLVFIMLAKHHVGKLRLGPWNKSRHKKGGSKRQ